MIPAVETLQLSNGLTGEIRHDDCVEQPYADNDDIRIVILSRRYADPAKGKCGTTPAELSDWTHQNADRWWVIPLYAYEHSGIVYRPADTNPFHCPFDSARAGSIALRRKRFPTDPRQLRLEAEEIAATYSQWANGECFTFLIRNASGDVVESGGGIFGYDNAVAALHEAASLHCAEETVHPPSSGPELEQGLLFE